MARAAAILGVLVKADGVLTTNRQLSSVDAHGRKTAASTDRSSKKMGSSFAGAAKSAAKMAGITVGAYAAIAETKKAVNATEELTKTTLLLSRNFGLTTKRASEWGAVAKARGVDGKQLTMGFKALSTAIRNGNVGIDGMSKKTADLAVKQKQEYQAAVISGKSAKDLTALRVKQAAALKDQSQKTAASANVFKELGISQETVSKHGNDLNFMIGAVSDGLKKLGPGTNRSAIQAKLFGRTWQTLSPLLRDGSGAMQEGLKTADKYGATLSGKGVKSAEEMIKKQRESKLAVLGLQVAIGTKLIPILTPLITGFASFVSGMRSTKGVAGILHDALGILFGAIKQGIGWLQGIIGWMKQSKDVMDGMRGAAVVLATALGVAGLAKAIRIVAGAVKTLLLAMVPTPILIIIGVVAALAGAFVIAYKHSAKFREIVATLLPILQQVGLAVMAFGQAVVKWVVGAFKAVIKWVSGAVKTVIAEVRQWDTLASFVSRVFGIIIGIAKTLMAELKLVFKVGMLVLGPIFTAEWTFIKGIFSGAFKIIKGIVKGGLQALHGLILIIGGLFKGDFHQIWQGIKTIFKGGITLLKGVLAGAWAILKAPVNALAAGIHDAFEHTWGRIKGVFSSGVNAAIDFLNVLIKAINLIPGLKDIKPIDPIGSGGGGGGGKSDPTPHKRARRRGGAFERTGGMVSGPITLMGEEAPRHPEYVIPTNPAYKGRAKGLLAQAATAIGFARGGVYDVAQMADLWRSKGGNASKADTMGVIGLVESGGQPWAHNPSGASGLWQILGQVVKGNIFNPGINALNAIAKSSNGRNLHPWDASRSKWAPLLGKQTGLGIGPSDIISKFPGVGKLPRWLKGTGRYVLSKATAWVKENVVRAVTGGGGAIEKGPGGVGTFEGVPMANWVISSLRYGRQHGAFGNPTSGYRPGRDPHTKSGSSEHQGTRYPHGAVDFGGYHDARARAEKMSYVNATAGYRYPLLAPQGFVDDGHASGTGHRKGGIFGPYIGAFRKGGIVPETGMALLHAGETVLPLKKGGKNKRPKGHPNVRAGGGRVPKPKRSLTPAQRHAAAMKKATRGSARAVTKARNRARPRRASGPNDAWDHNIQGYISAVEAQLAVAKLTKGTEDDLSALDSLRLLYKQGLKMAKKRGDLEGIKNYAEGLAGIRSDIASYKPDAADTTAPEDGGDPNQPLIDALAAQQAAQEALTAAEKEHTDALNGVKGELKAQTDLAKQISSTSAYQQTKFLADILSGQFGRGILSRSYGPGTGVEVAY